MIFESEELSAQLEGLRCHCPTFEGLSEAVEFGEKPSSDKWGRGERCSREGDSSFCGTKSWAEAVSIATYGWKEGRDMAAAQLDAIWESGCVEICQAPSEELDVSGYAPDVEAYIQGDPFCMLDDGDEVGGAPVIRLIVNVVASCGVSAEHIANRAAALAALVDVVESTGSSCEIWSMWTAVDSDVRDYLENGFGKSDGKEKKPSRYNEYRAFIPSVKLKGAGVPVAIDDIAFGLGHPSMLRRLMFAVGEADPFFGGSGMEDFQCGYGYPSDLPKEVIPKDAIYFHRIDRYRDEHRKYKTPEIATASILETYNKQAALKNLKEVGRD